MQKTLTLVAAGLGTTIVVVLTVGCIFATPYNSLVSGQNEIGRAQQQVDNVLQRRYEILMNEGAVVASYKDSQQKLVEAFVQATRTSTTVAQQKDNSLERTHALDQATNQGALALYALGKAEVKSDPQVWQGLMTEIEGSNNRVFTERLRLINAITSQQNRVEHFPGNLFANLYGFRAPDDYKPLPQTLQNPDLQSTLKP